MKQTEELLETRTAELSEAQTFLSTEDHLSEMEVLSVVRDLNEKIFQPAVSLAEDWKKLGSLQHWSNEYQSHFSTPVPVLVQLARG